MEKLYTVLAAKSGGWRDFATSPKRNSWPFLMKITIVIPLGWKVNILERQLFANWNLMISTLLLQRRITTFRCFTGRCCLLRKYAFSFWYIALIMQQTRTNKAINGELLHGKFVAMMQRPKPITRDVILWPEIFSLLRMPSTSNTDSDWSGNGGYSVKVTHDLINGLIDTQ